jgi:RNA polymerase sigma-70 factor (ECF subfamily)
MSQASTTTTLEQLLTQSRAGDGAALGRLLERYRNYLKLLAHTLHGHSHGPRGRLDDSDLIQETFLKAHRGFKTFQGQSEPELLAWLRRILARGLATQVERDRRQKRDRRREKSLEALLDGSNQALQQTLAAPGSSPSEQASHREQAVLLADALAQLTPDQQEVFLLRQVDHVPVAEIAERMGRTVPAVRMLWTRAVKELNRLLQEPP